jgi:hypothetical protein
MTEDLHWLFVRTARRRLDRAFEILVPEARDQARVAETELFTLAGEAAMLQLGDLAGLIKRAVREATAWQRDGAIASLTTCVGTLHDVRRALEELAEPPLAADRTRTRA